MERIDKTVTVSESTLGYLECLRQLSNLYDSVSNTIETHYGRSQVDDIMGNDYYPLHKAIHDWLYNRMNWSMDFKIYNGDELTTI